MGMEIGAARQVLLNISSHKNKFKSKDCAQIFLHYIHKSLGISAHTMQNVRFSLQLEKFSLWIQRIMIQYIY